MEDKEIVSFGEWIVPKSWDDITLRQYQEIERFYEDKEKNVDIREIIHILCNKTVDEVNQLPAEFLDIILEKLAFLQKEPEIKAPSNKIKIDGVEYKIHFESQLRTGELIASDTILKSDRHNVAALLGILCRKDDELYDSKFENEILEGRIKMFEEQPVMNVLPIVSFFMNSYIVFNSYSLLYTKVMEAINLTRKSIVNSQKIGHCKKLYLVWQMNRLQKRLKSTRHMQGTSSTTSHTSFKNQKWKKLRRNIKTT
jgi:hypothetical protein